MNYPPLRQILESFASEEACVAQLTRIRWARGPRCPRCTHKHVSPFKAKTKSGKLGKLYQCKHCRRQFSVTGGTIFHNSHRPLTDWLVVIYLMDSSKMRISAKEVERMLGVGYETAWHMHGRVSEAMKDKYQKAFLQALIGATEDHDPYRMEIGSRYPPLWKDGVSLFPG